LRLVIAVLALLLVLVQVQVWRQYARVAELEQRLEAQREENGELAARNDALAAEVTDLKSGLAAVEERARAELGLIRDGEEFFLVVEPEDLDPDDAEALRRQRAGAETDPPGSVPPDGDG
jgi:cell division protein FtsB